MNQGREVRCVSSRFIHSCLSILQFISFRPHLGILFSAFFDFFVLGRRKRVGGPLKCAVKSLTHVLIISCSSPANTTQHSTTAVSQIVSVAQMVELHKQLATGMLSWMISSAPELDRGTRARRIVKAAFSEQFRRNLCERSLQEQTRLDVTRLMNGLQGLSDSSLSTKTTAYLKACRDPEGNQERDGVGAEGTLAAAIASSSWDVRVADEYGTEEDSDTAMEDSDRDHAEMGGTEEDSDRMDSAQADGDLPDGTHQAAGTKEDSEIEDTAGDHGASRERAQALGGDEEDTVTVDSGAEDDGRLDHSGGDEELKSREEQQDTFESAIQSLDFSEMPEGH